MRFDYIQYLDKVSFTYITAFSNLSEAESALLMYHETHTTNLFTRLSPYSTNNSMNLIRVSPLYRPV
jgi:hypothetical protein